MVFFAFLFGGVILITFFSIIFISGDIDTANKEHSKKKRGGRNKHSVNFNNNAAFASFFSK